MSVYSHDHERVYVMRDIIPQESAIVTDPYFEQLRTTKGAGFVDQLHVSVLTNGEVRKIGDKYPRSHPMDLIINALGDLRLPEIQFAHVKSAEVFGRDNGLGLPRYCVASPLDSEGARRLNDDATKLLGYFGLERSPKTSREHRPHMTYRRVYKDYDYVQGQADVLNEVVDGPKPIAMSHPVVEHRHLRANSGMQKLAPFCGLSLIRRYWPGYVAAS